MISATGLVGIAAGVPYVAHRPAADCQQAPLVVVLHLMDPPRTEAAMAAALPLAGVPAWRAYLGLPMFGAPNTASPWLARSGMAPFSTEPSDCTRSIP